MRNVGKREVVAVLGGICALSVAEEPARADGLPGFKKDMRPVRSRNKVDPSLYSDGPEGLKCAFFSCLACARAHRHGTCCTSHVLAYTCACEEA